MPSAVVSHACMNENHLTRSVPGASDPWPLLRKRGELSGGTALRLVIHGRSGGLISPCLQKIVDAVIKTKYPARRNDNSMYWYHVVNYALQKCRSSWLSASSYVIFNYFLKI